MINKISAALSFNSKQAKSDIAFGTSKYICPSFNIGDKATKVIYKNGEEKQLLNDILELIEDHKPQIDKKKLYKFDEKALKISPNKKLITFIQKSLCGERPARFEIRINKKMPNENVELFNKVLDKLQK